MKKILILFLLLSQTTFAQNDSIIADKLIGYWEGAFIKQNAYQKIEVDFSTRDGKMYAFQVMEEWHPGYGEFEVPVQIDSTGQINFGTGYGKVALHLDKNNLEIIGQLVNRSHSVYVHLKKAAKRPSPNYSVEKVAIASENIELSGHLHLPFHNPTKTAIILVGGRGCGADETKFNLYAKFLREYGIAVLAYQKRGTGKSTGNCDVATIEDLAKDLGNVKLFLEKRKEGFEKIGVLGISAGGWTMTKAGEKHDFDFMISVVGPSTSVRDQQLQSAKYGADVFQLNATALDNVIKYTHLVFDVQQSKKGLEALQSLLAIAKDEGWYQLLESTDVANTESEIENLWVRRHNFDPKDVLRNYSKPFLGIYGQKDWIVPPKENIELLNEYFKNNMENLTTVNVYGAEHGMEMESKWVELDQDRSYWHFFRISPEVRIAIVDFLEKHGLRK